MNTTWDFSDVYDVLKDKVNPEITHYQNGQHPGLGWYLKTIIPCNNNGDCEINLAVNRLKMFHSHVVCTTPVAYNWEQAAIVGWHSLWIRDGRDIRFTHTGEGKINFEIWDQRELLMHEAEFYNIMIKDQMVKNKHNKNLVQDLKQLDQIASFLQNYSSDKTAKEQRSKFKVISGGKI